MNLKSCINDAGGARTVAAWLGLTPKSVYKWMESDCLPNTEFSGRTTYAEIIELKTEGKITKQTLLEVGKPKQVQKVA